MAVGRLQPGPDGARQRGARTRGDEGGDRVELPLPTFPGQLDRGRDHRGAQEHHRRARARPPEAQVAMNFDLNDEQQEIKRTAHEFLAARFKPEKVRELAEARSYDDGLWKEIAELGWAGIAVSEADGGQGLGMVELAVLLEESGYACAPSALLGSAGAALVISAAGSDEQRAEWLPKLASGEATGSFGGFGHVANDEGESTLFC